MSIIYPKYIYSFGNIACRLTKLPGDTKSSTVTLTIAISSQYNNHSVVGAVYDTVL